MSEQVTAQTRVFSGRRVTLELVEVQLDDGTPARREIVRVPAAVGVLPALPDGRIVLIRQYRSPIQSHILEIVAGCLEPGEDPAACAVREVREEIGYTVRALRPLGSIHPSPGFCDETIHLFHAQLAPGTPQPQPDPDERIAVFCLSVAEFDALVAAGDITDAKTLAAWLLFKTRCWPSDDPNLVQSSPDRR